MDAGLCPSMFSTAQSPNSIDLRGRAQLEKRTFEARGSSHELEKRALEARGRSPELEKGALEARELSHKLEKRAFEAQGSSHKLEKGALEAQRSGQEREKPALETHACADERRAWACPKLGVTCVRRAIGLRTRWRSGREREAIRAQVSTSSWLSEWPNTKSSARHRRWESVPLA
jgi:hypothetical protein